MTCQFDAFPQADLEWYFNEENITHTIMQKVEKYEWSYEPQQHSATLIIKNVNANDKGNYLLKMTNNLGVCKSICFLDVKGIKLVIFYS